MERMYWEKPTRRKVYRISPPLRVYAFNQAYFPMTSVELQALLATDRNADIIERFKIDKHRYAVLLRKSGDNTFPVFPRTARKVACDADIQRTVSSAGHDVSPIALATHCFLSMGEATRLVAQRLVEIVANVRDAATKTSSSWHAAQAQACMIRYD